ncbi:histidinol-phosphatase [Candidatus Sumerlaeota bacterium]|nr:histidinol-phosphatase [Candidatus Sumerlaeota bacterium]
MSWTNFHTHSGLCDGTGALVEYVEAALARGFSKLGFTSHAPVPVPVDWMMPQARLDEYCRTIRDLRETYRDRIEIYLGLEIDYIPGVCGPREPPFDRLGLDYVIGSVHFVDGDGRGGYWGIDGDDEDFAQGLDGVYRGDIRAAVEKYYGVVREMVRSQCPDIVGHLDVIKKNNRDEKYFSEGADWYREAVVGTLEEIAISSAIVEVNTGGLARGRTDSVYPSAWVLEKCFEMGIPVVLNSDAHAPEGIDGEFASTARLLRRIGFRRLMVLGRNGWEPREFSESGILD